MVELLAAMLQRAQWLARDLDDRDALAQLDGLRERAAGTILLDEQVEIMREIARLAERLREQMSAGDGFA